MVCFVRLWCIHAQIYPVFLNLFVKFVLNAMRNLLTEIM